MPIPMSRSVDGSDSSLLMTTTGMAEAGKVEYYKQLYTLNDISDEDIEEADIVQGSSGQNIPSSTPFPSSSSSRGRRSKATADSPKKPPDIHRTHFASVSSVSVVKETPLIRKTSLLRYDVSTPPSFENSFENKPSAPSGNPTLQERPEQQQRTLSDATRGSLVLKNSTGIASMLQGKKQKRQRKPEIQLVSEKLQIFRGKTFFYIPNDDVAKSRKARITNARRYGAIWTTQFGIEVTHVIVDKDLTYSDVLRFFGKVCKVEGLPSSMTLVNDTYPPECIQFRTLLDPTQKIYEVHGSDIAKGVVLREPLHGEEGAKHDDIVEDAPQTPPRKEVTPEPSPERPYSPKFSMISLNVDHKTPKYMETATSPRNPRNIVGKGDALDEMILLAQSTKGLGLDNSDSDIRPSSSNSPEDTDSGSARERSPERAPVRKKRKTNRPKGTFDPSSFLCMNPGTGKSVGNPNEDTIKAFQQLAEHYERVKDQWRNLSYRKGITALRKETRKITTREEAIQIPGIGESLAEKIRELHTTGRLRKLDETAMDPHDIILQKFMKIYGVGKALAEQWHEAGYRTLADLTAKAHLTPNQKIGIEYYDDFNRRIPRQEMDILGDIVKENAKQLDPEIEVTIGGSYRRGAETSGDIDFLITKPGTTSTTALLPFLHTLTTHLTQTSFLVAALAVPAAGLSSGSKWHGACTLPSSHPLATSPPTWRRIDFLLVPESEWGAALLYFTGDDLFNRSIRYLANRYGMSLNQRGLYRDVLRDRNRIKISEGELVEGRDERRIFDVLGVPFREPMERVCN